MKVFGLLILTAFIFNSCGVRRTPLPTVNVTHSGTGWTAAEQTDGYFLVIAETPGAENGALKSLCEKHYICTGPQIFGKAYVIRRQAK